MATIKFHGKLVCISFQRYLITYYQVYFDDVRILLENQLSVSVSVYVEVCLPQSWKTDLGNQLRLVNGSLIEENILAHTVHGVSHPSLRNWLALSNTTYYRCILYC